MDGSNMTERAYTASEIVAECKRLECLLGGGAEVRLSIAIDREEPVWVNVYPANTGQRFHFRDVTIYGALTQAEQGIALLPKPSDAWAIIGAEAA